MDNHKLFLKSEFFLQSISFNQVMLRKNVRKWRDFYNSYWSMWITLRVMIDIEGPLI